MDTGLHNGDTCGQTDIRAPVASVGSKKIYNFNIINIIHVLNQ